MQLRTVSSTADVGRDARREPNAQTDGWLHGTRQERGFGGLADDVQTIRPAPRALVSEDPEGVDRGPNLAVYVVNRPIVHLDPLGLQHAPGGPWHPAPPESRCVVHHQIRAQSSSVRLARYPTSFGPTETGTRSEIRTDTQMRFRISPARSSGALISTRATAESAPETRTANECSQWWVHFLCGSV